MKIHKKGIIVAAAITPLFLFGVATAQQGDTTTTTTTTEPEPTTQTEVKTGNEGLTPQQRAEKYKAAVKARLSAAEKTRLQSRCKASQGRVMSLKGRITGLDTSRTQVYSNLLDRLEGLGDKLEAKDIDTTQYDAQVAELTTKVTTYRTDLAKYKEAVGDLAELDCAADPDAFKAALETSRTLRATVVTDGKDIRTYMNDTIKPTLKTIREQVNTNQTTEGN